MTWQSILAIAGGGAMGAVVRAYCNIFFNSRFNSVLPLGTIFVNLFGAFLIGIVFALFYKHQIMESHIRSFLVVGFLGAFTTYSTFSMESIYLLESDFLYGVAYVTINLFGSLLFAFGSYKLILTLL